MGVLADRRVASIGQPKAVGDEVAWFIVQISGLPEPLWRSKAMRPLTPIALGEPPSEPEIGTTRAATIAAHIECTLKPARSSHDVLP